MIGEAWTARGGPGSPDYGGKHEEPAQAFVNRAPDSSARKARSRGIAQYGLDSLSAARSGD